MGQRKASQACGASSRTATGIRNRTCGIGLSQPSEDATAFRSAGHSARPTGQPGASRLAARSASRLALAASLILASAGAARAQVAVTPDAAAAVGPGTFYPKVGVCNQTTLPVTVEGYRFRTQNFPGYTTWLAGLSHTGSSPVEYTQPIPESEKQMQSGQCRAATDYTGILTAGQIGTLFDGQALIKTGSCAEAPKYTDAPALACTGLEPVRTDPRYADDRCLVDTVGTNGGDTFGGFVSTFAGQTQIQAVIPPTTFTVSNTSVRWNPYAYGPQYMMALAGAQELLNVDMQFLAAVAGKETFMGLVQAQTGTALHTVPVQQGVYGYWQVEGSTFDTWVKSYPQFFPKYGPCISRYPDVTTAFPTCAPSMEDPPIHYLRPTPTTQMGPNSPQLINGALVTALGFYALYDALTLSTDLCFIDIIKNAVDQRIALAVMLPGYNQGRYSGFETPLKTDAATIRTNPTASSRFSDGVTNYRSNIFNVLDQLVNAAKNCGATRKVYDTTLSIGEMKRFLFGGSVTPGTPVVQGDGGLLLHYELTVQQREALWDDITCAFDRLKGKAPSTMTPARAEFVSYRYDFLTLLRVVKRHLPFHIKDRRVPVEHDFNALVKANSRNNTVCGTNKPKDAVYPSLTLVSPRPGDAVEQIKTPGLTFTFKAADVGGTVAKTEWTLDKNWLAWKPARQAGTDTYAFEISCETPGWPRAGQTGKVWVSTTDDCGNTTVQELAFTVKPGTYCGDAPPLNPPVANPPGGGFFDSVRVTLEVPGVSGVTIHYTIDGSKPTAASPVYTGPIMISGNADVTLRAFATKPGFPNSDEASWVFTKQTRPLIPIAAQQGVLFDEDGDGRMERARVVFAKPLPATPARLSFTVVAEDGQSHVRIPAGAEITRDPADAATALVVFAQPFPFGVTSLRAGSNGRTSADAAIPLLDAGFPLEEQAAPVIVKAVVQEGDSAQPMKHIAITYSEPVQGPAASQTAWVFKRENGEMAAAEVRIGPVQGSGAGAREAKVFIDTASLQFPIRGDSVAIALTGEITDVGGRAPKAKLFRLLEGEAPMPKPVRFTILFPNGSTDRPTRGALNGNPDAVLIPLGRDGNPLPGTREQGRCPGCAAKDGDTYVGPVFNILTPGPLSYTFRIFTNLGEFVAEGSGRVDEKDLELVKKDRAGVNYEVPVVWTGNTVKGFKAATGAYVVMAVFNLEKDMRTGAGPSRHKDKKVFGLIRNL